MTTERTSERAIRESLDEAEWRIDPIHDDEDRIVEYALVAVSPGAQRVVATVPYRAYAEWLVERLNGLTRLAGTTPKMLRETLSACQSLVAESPLDQDKA
ncbi:MAG: hypothetical protein ACRDQD_12445, partial [Nocardioidaceae bacterium]